MASGWIRAGSFQAAYSVIQKSRGGSSGSVFSRMTEWDVRASVDVENLEARGNDYRTYGKAHGKGAAKTHWYSTPMNVQVGMSVVGMEQILGAFGVITQNVRDAAAKVLTESGERIKADSLERVPVRDWDLYQSWYPDDVSEGVYVDGDKFYLEIGYRGTEQGGVAYAWRQHEDATYVHPVRTELGRTRSEWKFLEYPANDERVRMLGTAISEMKMAVAKMGGVGVAPIPVSTRPALGTISGPRLVKKPKR